MVCLTTIEPDEEEEDIYEIVTSEVFAEYGTVIGFTAAAFDPEGCFLGETECHPTRRAAKDAAYQFIV